MIAQVSKFFGSKKLGLVLALVGAVTTLASLVLPMPINLQGALRAVGFALMMVALAPVWYADWKLHKPTSNDFSSKGFFLVYSLLVLISLVVSVLALKNWFSNWP
jgi:hypothetical protein